MQFGPVQLEQAEGAVLAHSVALPAGRLRKGCVLTAQDIVALRDLGLKQITVARLGPDDLAEDAAADALAQALLPGSGLLRSAAFTGRVNLNAPAAGVVRVDAAAVAAVNHLDPAITLATLAPLTRVAAGTLVGTVKIIAYGVERGAVLRACAAASAALQFCPVVRGSASLILTEVAGQDPKLTQKGLRAVLARLTALGMQLASVEVVAHDEAALGAAIMRATGDMVLILTGSATSDLYDTAPQALRRAGGDVLRFGMPVDPGNLLFLGHLGARPVIGLPGCARSPALNGADWVLERLACGIEVRSEDIAAMGVGGLLKEIATRPHLREP